jgi:hypothetical protein
VYRAQPRYFSPLYPVQMAVIISIHCKMAVMAIHRGLKTKSTIQIEFNIGEAEHALISKWNYKKNSTEYVFPTSGDLYFAKQLQFTGIWQRVYVYR